MESRNPATGALIARHPIHDAAEVDRRLDQGWAAWQAWRRQSLAYRAPALLALAEGLTARRAELSALMTAEMGKPLSEARAEIDKCAWVCRHYAEHAGALLTPRSVTAKAPHNEVRFEPLGPVLSVMPWNFPFWQVLRFAAPALMAGNTVLIKHASNVVGCAQAIEHLGVEAGLPLGLLQEIRVENDDVAAIIADPRVAAVTVTGSERAGRAVAAQAGRHLKPSVLELGGSDAFIVLADADLDAALDAAVRSRCLNGGQSCIGAKRFIVEAPLHDAFVEGLIARMEAQVVGDPTAAETDMGPLARPDLRDTLHQQVTASIEAGATLRTGGVPLDGPGNFYPPTVLTDVPRDCPAAQEELFGPVAAVFRADSPTDAVLRANDTRFGLSSSLWTADRIRARGLATRIDAGAVFINQMSYSDPRLPFGGIGASGYGRELGPEGILEFVNVKTVSVA